MESTQKFIFNPEHDLCLADGTEDFIPPAAVLQFAQQGEWIAKYMPVPQDAGRVVPWGWNRALRKRLLGQGFSLHELPSDEQLDFIRENSRRELAVELLKDLNDSNSGEDMQHIPLQRSCLVSADYRIIARSMEEIESFLQTHNRIVLKAPLSGSGKGIRFVTDELMETDRGWCRRTLQKQGAVIVEQRLEIQQEFAMLFEALPDGTVVFRGYSLFYATNGAYNANILASDQYIENVLNESLPYKLLESVRTKIVGWLQKKLSGNYKGFIGVDQFVCEGGILNPAVEINLRTTMGMVARNIYDNYTRELSLGEATHLFDPICGIHPLPGSC